MRVLFVWCRRRGRAQLAPTMPPVCPRRGGHRPPTPVFWGCAKRATHRTPTERHKGRSLQMFGKLAITLRVLCKPIARFVGNALCGVPRRFAQPERRKRPRRFAQNLPRKKPRPLRWLAKGAVHFSCFAARMLILPPALPLVLLLSLQPFSRLFLLLLGLSFLLFSFALVQARAALPASR